VTKVAALWAGSESAPFACAEELGICRVNHVLVCPLPPPQTRYSVVSLWVTDAVTFPPVNVLMTSGVRSSTAAVIVLPKNVASFLAVPTAPSIILTTGGKSVMSPFPVYLVNISDVPFSQLSPFLNPHSPPHVSLPLMITHQHLQ